MAHLTSVQNDKLTAGVLKTLKNNNIYNVIDFIRADSERLTIITKLPFKDVLEIRRFIFKNYSNVINGLVYHKHILGSFAILPTCILSLDNLLQGGLRCCKITEFCGLPDSGKTLLSLTIMCNISSILKQHVLYIDAKNDFEGIKFRDMMAAKTPNEDGIDGNLERVKIIKIWDMNTCLSFLHHLYSNKTMMKNIKLIVVDSLPSLVLQYKGVNSNTECFGYLNNFVNIVRRVSGEYNIPFIVINLLTRWVESVPNSGEAGPSYNVDVKPTLGRYWSHIPYVSLDVTKTSGQDVIVAIRSSNMFSESNKINMKISTEGIT